MPYGYPFSDVEKEAKAFVKVMMEKYKKPTFNDIVDKWESEYGFPKSHKSRHRVKQRLFDLYLQH